MQEEVTDKSIAFVSKQDKMTTTVLKELVKAYLREREKGKLKANKGQ